jgi:transcription initiation factor TFIID subunit 3
MWRGSRGMRIFSLVSLPGVDGSDLCWDADEWAVLKKKHSKTGEEARFQGTVLGKPTEGREVLIEGGDFDSIQAWEEMVRKRVQREASESPLTSPDTVMATPTDNGSTPGG